MTEFFLSQLKNFEEKKRKEKKPPQNTAKVCSRLITINEKQQQQN